MKLLLSAVIACCLISESISQNNDNCDIPDISSSDWLSRYTNSQMDDDDILLKEFEPANGHNITLQGWTSSNTDVNYALYFDVSANADAQLVVQTNEEFENFESQMVNQESTVRNMDITITMSCQGTSSNSVLRFRQPVIDVNNHDPEFSSPTYTYKVPMPLSAGVALSLYGSSIIVSDTDMTNMAMTFTIDTTDFSVTADGPSGSLNKDFEAVVTTTRALRYSESQVFTITATDAGTNPGQRSSTATIILEIDEENSYPESPSFVESYYTATYSNETDYHDLTINGDITLSSGSSDVNITIQGSYAEYFEATRSENIVDVQLKENLPDDLLNVESTLILTIVATVEGADADGTTVLIISLPRGECEEVVYAEPPSFASAYYTATYSNTSGEFELEIEGSITLSSGYSNAAVNIDGDYSSLFEVDRLDSTITVSITDNLPDALLDEEITLILTITAVVEGADAEATTALIIYLPKSLGEDTTSKESPTFAEPYYRATYNSESEPHSLDWNGYTISLSSGYSDADVTIDEEYSTYFQVSRNENTVSVSLNGNLPSSILDDESTLVLTLRATVEGAEADGVTVLVIALPSKNACDASSTAATTDCPVCELSSTVATECPVCSDTTTTSNSECPEITPCPECSTTSSVYPTECPETTVCPDFPETSSSTSCVCQTECPEASSTPLSSVGSSTTTAAPEPEGTVAFDSNVYQFVIKPDFIGSIGTLKATSSNEEESIIYSIQNSDGSSPTSVTISQSTGEIINVYYLDNGVNYFIAYAEGENSGAKGEATVIISVESSSVCGDEVRTGYSSLVKHITEEQDNYDIVVLESENVTDGFSYVIYDQYPTNGTSLFEINSETGNLQSFSIDREWTTISGMYQPQIVLNLRLINTTSSSRRRRSLIDDEVAREITYGSNRTWSYIENQILNIPNQIVVYVIVDDINDNHPVFESSSITVGYPKSGLAEEVLPPYLAIVHATDADYGYNASIYYSADSEYFTVHQTSGVVYPTANVEDDLSFLVTATDRNGTGLSSTMRIQVKALSESEITVLSTEKLVLEDIEEKLSELSAAISLNIQYLTASVVPKSESTRKTRDDDSDYYLRIVAYGLDSDDQPVPASRLQELLEELESDEEWNIQTWESISRDDTNNSSISGYVAGISVLAVLLSLLLIGGGAFYYFKIRPTNYKEMEESSEDTPVEEKKQPPEDLTQVEVVNDSPKGFTKNPNVNGSSSKISKEPTQRRPTGRIIYLENENFGAEGDDVDQNSQESNSDPVSTSPVRERKKSVAFNDNVERMQIDKDDDVEVSSL